MKEFDSNPKVTKWASEEVEIPYISPFDKRWHRYYPDFLIEWRGMEKFLIEVKPHKETMPPKQGKKTKRMINEQVTYGTNHTKWEAAIKWCDGAGAEFLIIHEHNVSEYFPGVKFLVPAKKKPKKSL